MWPTLWSKILKTGKWLQIVPGSPLGELTAPLEIKHNVTGQKESIYIPIKIEPVVWQRPVQGHDANF
jgi:hypothetical protein